MPTPTRSERAMIRMYPEQARALETAAAQHTSGNVSQFILDCIAGHCAAQNIPFPSYAQIRALHQEAQS